MSNLILQSITADELEQRMSKIVHQQLTDFFSQQQQQQPQSAKEKETSEFLTKKEVCKLLHVSLTTLWRWANEGTLTPINIAGKVLYRREDIDAVINPPKC